MINQYYSKFISGVRWGAFESIVYQSILIIHQLVLCKVLEFAEYGKVSAVYAALFLLARVLNLGFDFSVAPFFTKALQSKKAYASIIGTQLLAQSMILVALPCLLSQVVSFSSVYSYVATVVPLCIFIIFHEGIGRSLRTILYLHFQNKFVALIEIGYIITYVSMVWGSYYIGYPITLHSLLIALAAVLCATNILFAYRLYMMYTQLPEHATELAPSLFRRIVSTRFFNWCNQIIEQLYSSNFIIPLFAALLGPTQAGILKLVSSISYFISTVMKKTFGVTSSATLSHSKDATLELKQELFAQTTEPLFKALGLIGTFLFLHFHIFMRYYEVSITQQELLPSYLFLLFNFSENFIITYEKFYITEEKTHLYIFFNAVFLAMTCLLFSDWMALSKEIILLIAGILRIMSLIAIGIFAFYHWGIKPKVTLSFAYYVFIILSSLSFAYFNF